MARVIGYGLCGPDEKYLEQTLKEFERLCDETIILLNRAGEKEKALIEEYGFKTVVDNREWGKLQWQIKEDFLRNHVSKLEPEVCICLDMDEVFDKEFTRETIEEYAKTQWKSFYFFFRNLWDDGYNPTLNFENIRMWKWSYDLHFPRKNVHCGLAPEWVWYHGYRLPYIVRHYGLKDKTTREKKVKRYEKYDPNNPEMNNQYYRKISLDTKATPYNHEEQRAEVKAFIEKYRQTTPPKKMNEKEEIAYIELKQNGAVVPVPKKKLDLYLKQGHIYKGDHKDIMDDLDDILNEPVEEMTPIWKKKK